MIFKMSHPLPRYMIILLRVLLAGVHYLKYRLCTVICNYSTGVAWLSCSIYDHMLGIIIYSCVRHIL